MSDKVLSGGLEDQTNVTEDKKVESSEVDSIKINMNPINTLLLHESPDHREWRSSSDAYVHTVSRSRAAAVAAAARSSSSQLVGQGCCECRHYPLLLPQVPPLQNHLNPRYCPLHQSQGSLPHEAKTAAACSAHSNNNGAMPNNNNIINSSSSNNANRRSHSQSSLARLTVKPQTPHSPNNSSHRHTKSTSCLFFPSRLRATGGTPTPPPEEEVTYVWRNGRVQLQKQSPGTRSNGVGYSEGRLTSGQHVEYLWQSGNVQRVIRGSNNELLAAEPVPPRGPVKGVNYCIVLCLIIVGIVTVISLIFILRVSY